MFDNRYFKNKYVCRYGSGALSLMEVNGFRNEAYIYYSNDGKIDIYLRDFIKRPVKDDEFIMPVKTFFIEQGIDDSLFKNPFTRKKTIIKTLDEINKEEEKVLKK